MKAASPVSLIDFGADPEPTASAPPSQTGPTPQQPPQPVLEQGKGAPSVSGGDWASFDAFGQQQTPQVGSTVNPLESVLAQLSFSETPSAPNASAFPTSVDPRANDGGQSSMIEQSHSSLFGAPLGISGNQVPPFAENSRSVHSSVSFFLKKSLCDYTFAGLNRNAHPRIFISTICCSFLYGWSSISSAFKFSRNQWCSRRNIFW